jgi:heme-degrading monooxygenase HmoA
MMFARVTALEIDTLRVGVDDAVALFQEVVLPELHEQEGFRGVYVLATPEGKGLLLSLWETADQAAADQETGFYADVLERFVTLYRSPPGRDSYQVKLSEFALPAAVAPGDADPGG